MGGIWQEKGSNPDSWREESSCASQKVPLAVSRGPKGWRREAVEEWRVSRPWTPGTSRGFSWLSCSPTPLFHLTPWVLHVAHNGRPCRRNQPWTSLLPLSFPTSSQGKVQTSLQRPSHPIHPSQPWPTSPLQLPPQSPAHPSQHSAL